MDGESGSAAPSGRSHEGTPAGVAADAKLGVLTNLAIIGPFRDTGGGLDAREGPEAAGGSFADLKTHYAWGTVDVAWRKVPAAFSTATGVPLDVFVHPRKGLGGDKILARYDADPDLEKVKEQIRSVQGINLRDSPTNPQVTNPRDHRVEIQLQSKGDQLMDALRGKLGADTVPALALRVEWVGPKAGKQLRDNARNSVAIAIVFIMLYLAFRFDLRRSRRPVHRRAGAILWRPAPGCGCEGKRSRVRALGSRRLRAWDAGAYQASTPQRR